MIKIHTFNDNNQAAHLLRISSLNVSPCFQKTNLPRYGLPNQKERRSSRNRQNKHQDLRAPESGLAVEDHIEVEAGKMMEGNLTARAFIVAALELEDAQ